MEGGFYEAHNSTHSYSNITRKNPFKKELYQISSRLGHSSYATTVNKYGHLSTEIKKEIANTTDKYL